MAFVYATTEKVVTTWLGQLDGLSPAMVDQTLPADNTTWAASGFVTPYVTGGTPDPEMPVAHPVVTLKFWATTVNQGYPPWGKAQNLAEIVRNGCYGVSAVGDILTVPNCDQRARVLSAYLVSEPRRSYGDAGDYACFVADLAFHWAPA